MSRLQSTCYLFCADWEFVRYVFYSNDIAISIYIFPCSFCALSWNCDFKAVFPVIHIKQIFFIFFSSCIFYDGDNISALLQVLSYQRILRARSLHTSHEGSRKGKRVIVFWVHVCKFTDFWKPGYHIWENRERRRRHEILNWFLSYGNES